MFNYMFANDKLKLSIPDMASKLIEQLSEDELDVLLDEIYDYRDDLYNHGKIIMALWDKESQIQYLTEVDKVDKLVQSTKQAIENYDCWF